MTVKIHRLDRSQRTFQCRCGAACVDMGMLEEHILSTDDADHWPSAGEHVTDRLEQAQQAIQRRQATREKVARAAGVSVDELREALR